MGEILIRDLQPGNLVEHKYAEGFESLTAYQIAKYADTKESNSYYNTIVPIALTKKWCEDLGFQMVMRGLYEINILKEELNGHLIKRIDLLFQAQDSMVSIEITNYHYNNKTQKSEVSVSGVDFDHIKSVHQLQNLYSAFTGKKLNLIKNEENHIIY